MVAGNPLTRAATVTKHLKASLQSLQGASTAAPRPAIGSLTKPTVSFLGAPFCHGQNLLGADLAPATMRDSGIFSALQKLGWSTKDCGDIDFDGHFEKNGYYADGKRRPTISMEDYRQWRHEGMKESFSIWAEHRLGVKLASEKGHSGPQASAVAAGPPKEVVNASLIGEGLRLVYEKVLAEASEGNFVLTIGGDHSIASATIAALSRVHGEMACIWVDAHADANTPETSPSMHYHGMPAAHALGWFNQNPPGFEWYPDPAEPCLKENRLAYIGLRDVDELEGMMLRRSGVTVYTMRDVDKYGIGQVVNMAMEKVNPSNKLPLHLTLDIDAVDPEFAPGTGTLARGGLSYREVHYICEECADSGRLVSMDLVEVNPGIDCPAVRGDMHGDNPSIASHTTPTVRLGVELCLSALGKSIY
mmetsp:Transcript_41747/g.100167  ORF Transcript_41747/g.100167 Transcript_41747/m.100167 type:complete len:418 (+) Transcript_41747:48-1301(+)